MSASLALWTGAAAALAVGLGLAGWSRADRLERPGVELLALTADASGYLAQVRIAGAAEAVAASGAVRLVGPGGGLCHAAPQAERGPAGAFVLRFPLADCLEPLGLGAEARLSGEMVLADERRVTLRLSGQVVR